MLTYELVSSASRQGLFLVLHPNIALSELAFVLGELLRQVPAAFDRGFRFKTYC